jgi:uncharacterized lipoprotein YajG
VGCTGVYLIQDKKIMKNLLIPGLCLLLLAACQESEKKTEPAAPAVEV